MLRKTTIENALDMVKKNKAIQGYLSYNFRNIFTTFILT